jgi:hypothetical protein
MATQPNAIPEGDDAPLDAPVEQIDPPVDDTAADGDDPPSDEDPVSKLAMDMGWVPQDRYKGDPGKWKPADQFIRDGRDIQRDQARDIRELKSTMETVAKTSAQILADRIESEKAKLAEQYNAAVEDGDAKRAFEIGGQIHKLDTQEVPQASGPSPEAQDFAARNAHWFNKDPLATQLAIDVTNKLARYPHAEQLRSAEAEVRRVYPHLFQQGKAPPGVAEGSRVATQARGPKGVKDLPPAARKVAQDMVDRGLIPNLEAYATPYFKNQEAGR